MPDIIFNSSSAINSRKIGQQWVNVVVGFTAGFTDEPTNISVIGAPSWLDVALIGTGLVKQIEFNTPSPVPAPVAQYDITVTVSNSTPETTGAVPYTFFVKGNTAPTLSSISLIRGQWDEPFEAFIEAGNLSSSNTYVSESDILNAILLNRPYWLNAEIIGVYPNQLVRLFGTPTAAGTFIPSLFITNEVGNSNTVSFIINIAENRLFAVCPKKEFGNNDIRAKFLLDLDVQYNSLTAFTFAERFALNALPITQVGAESLGESINLAPQVFLPQQGQVVLEYLAQEDYGDIYRFVRECIKSVEIYEKPLTGSYDSDGTLIYFGDFIPDTMQSNGATLSLDFANKINEKIQRYKNDAEQLDFEYLDSVFLTEPNPIDIRRKSASTTLINTLNYTLFPNFVTKLIQGLGARGNINLIHDTLYITEFPGDDDVVNVDNLLVNYLWTLANYDNTIPAPINIPAIFPTTLPEVLNFLCTATNSIAGVNDDGQGFFCEVESLPLSALLDDDVIEVANIRSGTKKYDGLVVLSCRVKNAPFNTEIDIVGDAGFHQDQTGISDKQMIFGDVRLSDALATDTTPTLVNFYSPKQIFNNEAVFVAQVYQRSKGEYRALSNSIGTPSFVDYDAAVSFPFITQTTLLPGPTSYDKVEYDSVIYVSQRRRLGAQQWNALKDAHEVITLKVKGKNWLPYVKYQTEPTSRLGYVELRPIRITKNHNDCTSEIEFLHLRNL